MKSMLIRHWTDTCGMLLLSMAAFSRPALAVADALRRNQRTNRAGALCGDQRQSFASKPLYVVGLQLLAGIGLTSAAAMTVAAPMTAGQAESSILDSATSWNLTGTTIVSKGKVDVMREGEFAHDFILESRAVAVNPEGSVVPAGTFKLVLSAFSPAYDQRGQKKGAWYVWGKWTLTDSSITQPGIAGRQRAGEISGQISAELNFNPVVTQQNWTAKIRLPMTRIAPVAQTGSSRPARGEGALTMDDKREGKMSLNLKLWPAMQH